MCVCVCERERERGTDRQTGSKGKLEGTNWCVLGVKREEEKLERTERESW